MRRVCDPRPGTVALDTLETVHTCYETEGAIESVAALLAIGCSGDESTVWPAEA